MLKSGCFKHATMRHILIRRSLIRKYKLFLYSNARELDLICGDDALPDWKEDRGRDVWRCKIKVAMGFRSSFFGLLTLSMMIEKHTIALIQKVGIMSTHPERIFRYPAGYPIPRGHVTGIRVCLVFDSMEWQELRIRRPALLRTRIPRSF